MRNHRRHKPPYESLFIFLIGAKGRDGENLLPTVADGRGLTIDRSIQPTQEPAPHGAQLQIAVTDIPVSHPNFLPWVWLLQGLFLTLRVER